MDKCVIWGSGQDYEHIINQLRYEELKGSIQIEAVVTRKDEIFGNKKDGYLLITKKELREIEFDILIITSTLYYREIFLEAERLGISADRIICGKAFELPLFDYNRYISLVKNPVTILSDDCLGGVLYNTLFLRMSSPLINMYLPKNSYCKFMKNPFYYFEQPLRLHREGNIRENICPIGRIGDGDNAVYLELTHYLNFKQAEEKWEHRRKRINKNRLFVKMSIDGTEENKEECLEVFKKVQVPKICFYSGKTSIKDVIYLKRFEWLCTHEKIMESVSFQKYVIYHLTDVMKDIDILKLLNGEKDYLRYL